MSPKTKSKSESTLDWRVTELEERVDKVGEKIEKILTNHLPHINEDIRVLNGKLDVLDTKIKYSLLANGIQIVALVIGLVLLLK